MRDTKNSMFIRCKILGEKNSHRPQYLMDKLHELGYLVPGDILCLFTSSTNNTYITVYDRAGRCYHGYLVMRDRIPGLNEFPITEREIWQEDYTFLLYPST